MDEEDGKTGPRARQPGQLNALSGVPALSLRFPIPHNLDSHHARLSQAAQKAGSESVEGPRLCHFEPQPNSRAFFLARASRRQSAPPQVAQVAAGGQGEHDENVPGK